MYLKYFAFTLIMLMSIFPNGFTQQVRIMPLGNSITYDSNGADKLNPRPEGDRVSYRYKLYQLMQNEDYSFDFVGSENSGNNYFQDSEYDDNAGFPAIQTWQLKDLINTGYNAMTGSSESPGPYLYTFPADIILLHIGTNNLTTSAGDVEVLLDKIRYYAPDVYILVSRIINRATYSGNTTTFNDNVEQMVDQRNDSRIVIVDMEDGAGIDYSTDMADNLHPNIVGYEKMAYKWFAALKALNNPPTTTQIPEQYSNRGEAFDAVFLDDFVEDSEDADDMLTWTFSRQFGSQLTVSIDQNRVLNVMPDGDWYGSEVITLEVEDSGGDVFPRTSKVLVDFTVRQGNDPPVIISTPLTEILQEETYSYQVEAIDNDGDNISYTAVIKPSWLDFNQESQILSGVPDNDKVGIHEVILRVSDEEGYNEQEFQVEVIDVNDPPFFTSEPAFSVEHDDEYLYVIYADDLDGDNLIFEVLEIPDWLTYNPATRVLSGIPSLDDLGEWFVSIIVNDGSDTTYQNFSISVLNSNEPPEFMTSPTLDATQDELYYYNVLAKDDDGDELNYSTVLIPEWLSFDLVSKALMGTPANNDVGQHSVILSVSDGSENVEQEFVLTVANVNDSPEFTTDPLENCRALQSYIYKIEVMDIDSEDNLTIAAMVKPAWLTFTAGLGEALLFGTPGVEHIGSHGVILAVNDGEEDVMQAFNIVVGYPVSTENIDAFEEISVYPNPSEGRFYFRFPDPSDVEIRLFDSAGMLRKTISAGYTSILEVDISDFAKGIYFYEALTNGEKEIGKLIKY